MKDFCSDQFWDANLTWGNHRPYPEFTECFQHTVIRCFGCLWLWLAVPIYLFVLQRHYKFDPLARSWLYTTKQSLTMVQLSIRFLQLKSAINDVDTYTGSYYSARSIGLIAEGFTLLLVMIIVELERSKRFITSGVLSIYWLLTSLSGSVLFYSAFVKENYDGSSAESALVKTWLGFAIVQLALCFFPEQLPKPIGGGCKECQLARSSFFSRCVYGWITGFMVQSYSKPLELNDFSKLMPAEQSTHVAAHFEEIWNEEVQRQMAQRELKHSGSKLQFSLLKVLLKAHGHELIGSNLLRLLSTVFDLAMPILLGCLIGLAEDSSQPTWKGFVYLAMFLTCLTIQCSTRNYVYYLCECLSLKLKASIMNAVFKKPLRMTNQARTQSTTGEIVNLMTSDTNHVRRSIAYIWMVWSFPFYVISCFILLYRSLGVGALAGGAILVAVMPLNAYFAKKVREYNKAQSDQKDERIKLLTEIINGIKILKLYAWELAFGDRILDMRREELITLKKNRLIEMIGTFSWCITPMLMGLASFATYVYVDERHVLTAQTAFGSLVVLGILADRFNAIPHVSANYSQAWVSLKRLDAFLNSEDIDPNNVTHEHSENAISVENGTFYWDRKLGATLKHIYMTVPKGSLVAVVGRVGTGKSSLLSAILGEIEKKNGKVNVDGDIAYVPQQAWIQNDTLQNNILFGKKLNPMTYKAVTDACALVKDLDILPGGDKTEIGEKGINLSGGQKQRVSMARAVYHNADIYLLDDPLSAVDAHVGKHIFDHVIGSKGFLRNKTRVLVTNSLTFLPDVNKIFVMDNGEISESGTFRELLVRNGTFGKFIREYRQDRALNEDGSDVEDPETATGKYEKLMMESGYCSDLKSDEDSQSESELTEKQTHMRRSISRALSHENKILYDEDTDNTSSEEAETETKQKGKFVDEEEIAQGKVQLKYILPYLAAVGRVSCIAILVIFAAFKFSEVALSICIKEWSNNVDLKNVSTMSSDNDYRKESNRYYIGVYASVGMLQGVVLMAHEALLAFAIIRAAATLHEKMLTNVLRGKMSFFDTTPVGRIVNRFSHDMDPLDGSISGHIEWFLHVVFGICSIFFIVMYSIPKFVVMVVPVVALNYYMQKHFVPARRQISRLESKMKSPVFSYFSETLAGTSVIRAFGSQARFVGELSKRIDVFHEMIFHNVSIDRWLSIRLDIFNMLCFFLTVTFALNERFALSAAAMGLLMQYALRLNDEMRGLIRVSGELERSVVSIERIGQYSSRETEAPLHTTTIPKENWPNEGVVEFKNYSMRYRPETELVLKKISVAVRKGEKVGIVGRTGAGKSSLTLGLFRLIESTEGSVNIDGHDISKLGLFDLRSNLTILPQEPIMFSGTLKTNIDPMSLHSEETILNALEHAHLKEFVMSLPGKLEYECGESGQNLSVGQRQLICLARSLLRKSKVLVLDEATSAVDMQTDELIQNTIKSEFKDCTVLTIAHRLNTVIEYDRILVLSYGEVKEFDSPKTLLRNKDSIFYSMAKDANLVL